MKRKHLIKLGFIEEIITPEITGYNYTFVYFTLDIGDVTLITNEYEYTEENDNIKSFKFIVSIFDSETNKITNKKDIVDLVGILKRNDSN